MLIPKNLKSKREKSLGHLTKYGEELSIGKKISKRAKNAITAHQSPLPEVK
jgi:hypothetical protein